MSYTLSRNYDTDLSRTDAHSILENMAHAIVEARGRELPTKKAFKIPDLTEGRDNGFTVDVLPTVSDAGFEPEHLVPSECVYSERYYVCLHGVVAASEDEPAQVRVTLRKARNGDARNLQGETATFEDHLEMLERLHKGV